MKGSRLPVKSVNDFLSCYLCRGYLIDATTIIECLHSFCKSCIVKYLDGNKYCPICDVQIHKARPLLHVKSDETLQDIVYKLVPGLYAREMKRRRIFYESRPEDAHELLSNEEKGQVAEGGRLIFDPQDPISLSIEYYPSDGTNQLASLVPVNEDESSTNNQSNRRFYSCPGSVQVQHLKKLIRNKYSLQPKQQVSILYLHDVLKDSYNMMDIAYIYSWKRNEPLRLFFSVDHMAPPPHLFQDPLPQGANPREVEATEPSQDCDKEEQVPALGGEPRADVPAEAAPRAVEPRLPQPTASPLQSTAEGATVSCSAPPGPSVSCSVPTSTIPASVSHSSSSITIPEIPSPKVATPSITTAPSLVKNGTQREVKDPPLITAPLLSIASSATLTTTTATMAMAVSTVESHPTSVPPPYSTNGHLAATAVHRPPLIFNKTLAQSHRMAQEIPSSGTRQLRPKAPPSAADHSHNNGHVAGGKLAGKGNHMYPGMSHFKTAAPTFINKELAKGLYPPHHPLLPFSTAEQLAKFVSQVPASYMNSLAFTNPLLAMPPTHRFQKEPPSSPTSARPNSARIKHTPPKNKSSPPTSSYPPGSLAPPYKSTPIYSPSLPPPERPPPPYMLPSPYGLPYGVPTSSYGNSLPPPYFATPSGVKRLPESPLPPQNKKLKVSQHLGYLLDGHTRKHQVVPRANGKAFHPQDKAKHLEMLEHRRNSMALQKTKESSSSYKELLTSTNKELSEKEKASFSQIVKQVTKASPLKQATHHNGVRPTPPKPQVNLNAFPSLAPPPSLVPLPLSSSSSSTSTVAPPSSSSSQTQS